MKLVFALTLFLSYGSAKGLAPIIEGAGQRYGQDQYMISAVIHTESRFTRVLCHKGAYGYMQVQIGDRSCSYQAYLRAGWLDLHDTWHNIDRGTNLMRYWKDWCLKNHKRLSKGKRHHWLLHYNQGYGQCPRGMKGCSLEQRIPVLDGDVGGYADRVLRTYKRLKSRANRAQSS